MEGGFEQQGFQRFFNILRQDPAAFEQKRLADYWNALGPQQQAGINLRLAELRQGAAAQPVETARTRARAQLTAEGYYGYENFGVPQMLAAHGGPQWAENMRMMQNARWENEQRRARVGLAPQAPVLGGGFLPPGIAKGIEDWFMSRFNFAANWFQHMMDNGDKQLNQLEKLNKDQPNNAPPANPQGRMAGP